MTERDEDLRTVGEVAELLGLSVRTLHHWEESGLVTPTARTWSNYRLYSRTEIVRLQQVMIYRATGMNLAEIRELLSDDDQLTHLRRQRDLLKGKAAEVQKMLGAVERLMEEQMEQPTLSTDQIAAILKDGDFAAHQEEAEQRWGETSAWKTSQARARAMDSAQWESFKTALEELEERLAEAQRGGITPGSDRANELAEEHRQSIGVFFPVTHAQQVLIARGYVADPRFKEHYDQRQPGLAQWLKASIDANAQAQGVDPESAQWD